MKDLFFATNSTWWLLALVIIVIISGIITVKIWKFLKTTRGSGITGRFMYRFMYNSRKNKILEIFILIIGTIVVAICISYMILVTVSRIKFMAFTMQ